MWLVTDNKIERKIKNDWISPRFEINTVQATLRIKKSFSR